MASPCMGEGLPYVELSLYTYDIMRMDKQEVKKSMKSAVKVNFEQYVRLALSHAEFSQNEDGSWTAEIPVLPGCVTWGTTRSEVVEMARDAVEAWVLTALRFGDEIPVIDGNSLQDAVDEIETEG